MKKLVLAAPLLLSLACTPAEVSADAGVKTDAGSNIDAGTTFDAGVDAGVLDAGVDAGIVDAGTCYATPTVVVSVTTAIVAGLPVALLATPADSNAAAPCSGAITPFSYHWLIDGQPTGSQVALNNPSAANPSFVPDLVGTYSLAVIATDALGNRSAPTSFTVNVTDTCRAPISPPQVAVNGSTTAPFNLAAGVPVLLSATISDPNTTALGCATPTPYTYQWALVALPAGSRAALNSLSASTPSFTPDLAAGTAAYSVQLKVTDAAGNQSPTVQVDLNAPVDEACNQPPSLSNLSFTTPGNTNITNNPVTVAVVATNPNPASCYTGGATPALSYQWSLLARPATSTAQLTAPLLASPRYTPDVVGTYAVSVRVTDALGNTATLQGTGPQVTSCGSSFSVVPVVTSSPAELGQSVTLAAQVSDPFNAAACGLPSVAPFSYAWTLSPPTGSGAVLSNGRSAQASFVPDVAGAYGYSVTVTDATGTQVSVASLAGATPAPVDARDCALTPAIATVGPTTGLTVGSAPSLTGSYSVSSGCGGLYTGSSGANPLPVRWHWSFDAAPAGSTSALVNASAPVSGFTIDRPGATSQWVVRLTVEDVLSGATSSATASFGGSACGTASISALAGVLSGPPCVSGLCTLTFTPPATLGTAVLHPAPPAGLPDYTYGHGTLVLPYALELFAGDVTAVGASTLRPSAGSPNAACGGVLSYEWLPYQVPPGSLLPSTFGPTAAAAPAARLDVIGDYVFQLRETDSVPGLPSKTATSYLWIRVQ